MNLGRVTGALGDTLYRQVGRASSQIQRQRSLPVDVLEGATSYLVVFDAPGAEIDDLQVRYVDGTVRVRIDRFREFREGYEMRFPGRSMSLDGEAELPADAIVDADAGTARFTENGSLRIEIPKGEPERDADREALTVEDDS